MNSDEQKVQDMLLAACHANDLAAAKTALDGGARPTPTFLGTPSPLMYAADCRNLDLVRLLLEAGADVAYRDDVGATALECAAVVGDQQIAALLLSFGASDEPNKQGVRPSEYADHHGHSQVAELIRRHGTERRSGS